MSIIVSRNVDTHVADEFINTKNIIRMWKSEVTTKGWRKPASTKYYLWFKFVDGSQWGWHYETIKKRDESFVTCGEIMLDAEKIVVDLVKDK